MPAKDFLHDAVRTALEKDGWTITDDPLTFKAEGIRFLSTLQPNVLLEPNVIMKE